MNYRHFYHAGSFSDVFKHFILMQLLESLKRKDKAFCYLDTHAGIGKYDLQDDAAQKTKEYQNGILPILAEKELPEFMQPFCNAVLSLNNGNADNLRFYPGSPLIANYFIRPQDRMILIELHPEDVVILKQEFANNKQIAVHHQNGYLALKAFLPPKEKRGLVLIDPPYESLDEFTNIIENLKIALKRWKKGIYAVWYPLTNRNSVKAFYQQLQQLNGVTILAAEFAIHPLDSPLGLNACGMVIINPPWQFDQQLQQQLPWLWQTLAVNEKGYWQVDWLVG